MAELLRQRPSDGSFHTSLQLMLEMLVSHQFARDIYIAQTIGVLRGLPGIRQRDGTAARPCQFGRGIHNGYDRIAVEPGENGHETVNRSVFSRQLPLSADSLP